MIPPIFSDLPPIYYEQFYLTIRCIIHQLRCTMASHCWAKWKTPLSLLKCANSACQKVTHGRLPDTDVSFQSNQKCPFMMDCECNCCHSKWIICTQCDVARKQISNATRMPDHIRHSHPRWFEQTHRTQSKRKTP